MHPQVVDVGEHLAAGANTMAVEGTNEGKGLAGLILKMKAELADGRTFELATDASWTSTQRPEDGWNRAGFKPGDAWQPVKVVGAYGAQPGGTYPPGRRPGRPTPRRRLHI